MEKNKNPRRFETDYYTERLPKNEEEIDKIKMQRDSAELGLGIIYLDKLKDTNSGTKTLEHLLSTPPYNESITLAALYNLFKFNRKENPDLAKKYGDKIITEYPTTKYAEFVLNPDAENKTKSSEAIVYYQSTYKKYEMGEYEEAKKMIEEGLTKFPSDEIVPKFTLLMAFCEAKMGNKQGFLDQLERVSLLYNNLPEGEKAAELLNYFKKQEEAQRTIQILDPVNPKEANTNPEPENTKEK